MKNWRRIMMKEIILNVKGMMCGGCENRIQNIVKGIEGVENIKADHNTGKVAITLNKDVEIDVIIEAIEDIGYEVVKEG